jgi:hypothetical protein
MLSYTWSKSGTPTFHVLVFFLNVLKCILKHSIFQYYAMKSQILLLLIIKIKIMISMY